MAKAQKPKAKKQTVNRRQNGQFARGNKLGKQFQPGKTGNPAGRPKRTKLTEALMAKLTEMAPRPSEYTIAEKVAQALIDEALKGNVQAIREIFDRTEGKPKQIIDVSVEERKREMVEDAIAALIEQAQVSREEAIEQLTAIAPEMSLWIN